MFAGRTAEHQLRSWMERPGNWRFKALLASALPEAPWSAEEMGRALVSVAQDPETKQHHLSKRKAGAYTHPPRQRIRPLGYADKTHSTGRKTAAEYKEPSYARELSDYNETQLRQGVDLDEYMGRMLVNESFTEKDVLWREQLLDTIVAGAEEAKVARDVANVVEVNTRRGDHPVRADEIFAPEIAEGGTIPFDEVDWSQQSWNADKFGLGAYVTDTLVDHALVDIIDQNIRWLGAAVENAMNRRFMNTLVDNPDSNNDVSVGAGNSFPFGFDLDPVVHARDTILNQKYGNADTIVMHPEFHTGLTMGNNDNNLIFDNRAGEWSMADGRTYPNGLFGISEGAMVPDGPYNSSSNTWGFAADGEFGAVMYPQEFMYLYLYRDLESKDFEDPIRDIEGANVRAWFDAGLGQKSAFSRLSN